MAKYTSAEARFFAKVRQDGDCWIWTAHLSTGGYGRFGVGTTVFQAHRWIFEFMVAEIPEGLQLDHLCRNRACVNPYHLEPVTPAVNTQRGIRAGTVFCPRGHQYTPENTMWRNSSGKSNGRRFCRTCQNDRRRVKGQRAWNADKTHCKRGHEFTEENTRYDNAPNGGRKRTCRTCEQARDRAKRRAA